jgi:hypothetical protein|tara:strand:+ start:177 stop:1391 length:1215 start_codon:yes stop_codon:yes gene_type:complete
MPFIIRGFICFCLILITTLGFGGGKRVAILSFEDHSRFDSPTGCGCIPTGGLIGKIFGGTKRRTDWDLSSGFRILLNRKLAQTQVYEPITQDEIMDGMAKLRISRKSVISSAKSRDKLLKELNAEVIIIGDVRKFNQERVRANASRSLIEGSTGSAGKSMHNMPLGYMTGYQMVGYAYFATVNLNADFFGVSGEKIATRKVSARKQHQLGGAKIAAFEAITTEQGSEFRLGQSPKSEEKKKLRPIVNPALLRKIGFGSPTFDRTLFGLATDEALEKIVLALREIIGPELITDNLNTGSKNLQKPVTKAIAGKIIYADPENPDQCYINIGSAQNVAVQQKLEVITAEPLVDPDTSEVLGYLSKKIGMIEVTEIQTDRLSKVRIIEGFGRIKKGDEVKTTKVEDPE